MRYISGKAQIKFKWTIWKHENTTKEDFDAGLPKVILIGPEDKYYIPVELVKGDLVGALPTMLPSGVYTLKAMWAKNKSRRFDGKVLVSEAKCFMGISYDEEEIDKDCKEIHLAIRTCIGTYGTDGFTAYEIAVMYGQTDLKETEWSNVNVDLAEAENERRVEERKRSEAEGVRVTNENLRYLEEQQRMSKEDERDYYESLRKSAEEERKANETERQLFESRRKDAESKRDLAEKDRQANEEDRNNSEGDRWTAELERETNEQTRIANETDRERNEAKRNAAENVRIQRENDRVNAELERDTKEAAREAVFITNEQARSEAFARNEAAREQTFAQKEAERDEAISSVTEFEEQVQFSVKIVEQSFTEEQKKQACKNIGVFKVDALTQDAYDNLVANGDVDDSVMYVIVEE